MPALRANLKTTHCLSGLINGSGLRDFVRPGIRAEWRPPTDTGYAPEESADEETEDLPDYETGVYED